MRQAPRIIFTAILTLFVFTTVIYTACKKDKCKDITCQNGGTCSDGVCNCPANYSGSKCEVAGPCAGVVCQNGGTCNNGACACIAGYEGNYCETESRAKFKKTWTASDTNTINNGPKPVYTSTISNGASVTLVGVGTFFNGFFQHDVIGTVKGDSIIVASQQPDANNNLVSGNAVFINDTLYWYYTVTTAGTPVNYRGTWR